MVSSCQNFDFDYKNRENRRLPFLGIARRLKKIVWLGKINLVGPSIKTILTKNESSTSTHQRGHTVDPSGFFLTAWSWMWQGPEQDYEICRYSVCR